MQPETYGNDYEDMPDHISSWMASIVCLQKQKDQISCSGSLLSDRTWWIITAAHCFYKQLVMEAVKTSIIIAILCAAFLYAIESQSPKTRGRQSKAKEQLSPSTEAKCGISANEPYQERIVGGVEARPHSWPWHVLIECTYYDIQTKNSNRYKCGGSIISDKWILTAAHCVLPEKNEIRRNCEVYLGKHDLRHIEPTQLKAKVTDYCVHKKYVRWEDGYDIALLKLAKPVKFTSAIQPICLPFGLPDLPFNKSCIAIGWGRTKYEDGVYKGGLMQLSMAVIDKRHCPLKNYFPDRSFCATTWDMRKDTCLGDSGGPLACKEPNQKWYVRGLTSAGPTYCNDSYGIFTKVAYFEKWIKKITSGN